MPATAAPTMRAPERRKSRAETDVSRSTSMPSIAKRATNASPDSDRQRAIDGPDAPQPYGSIPNSDSRWHGGAVGSSYTWADGYAGISYNGYDANYGSVAEDDVRLRMHQDHIAAAS